MDDFRLLKKEVLVNLIYAIIRIKKATFMLVPPPTHTQRPKRVPFQCHGRSATGRTRNLPRLQA